MTTILQYKMLALLIAILAVLGAISGILNHDASERENSAKEAIQFQQRVVQKMNQKVPNHLNIR